MLADVVVPDHPADAVTSLTPGFDRPSSVEEQLSWLAAAGFQATIAWTHRDLAVIVAEAVYHALTAKHPKLAVDLVKGLAAVLAVRMREALLVGHFA